jgi:non-reducing end alpha-L-arabinofuranosidase
MKSDFNHLKNGLILVITFTISQATLTVADCPCDIYEAAGTPCVAAYSMVRVLSNKYTGPLYQVRRSSDKKTQDITATGGFANSAEQETFLGSSAGTISKLYDQSGKGNDLTVAKKGCYTGDASKDDNESDAKGRSLSVNGHKVYGLYMKSRDGYRNNQEGYTGYPAVAKPGNGMPTGSQAQGIYMVVDPKRGGGGCCWDFGNGSTNNCNGATGQMCALYIGKDWGKGAGSGPWFAVDFEAGVWAGGTNKGDPGWGAWNETHPVNPNDPSMTMDYAFGIVKTNATNYCIRAADAQSGKLTTAYDGALPVTLHWKLQGSIVLGIGGDNSILGYETFFEGVITAGQPTDAADTAVLKNVQAAGYGSTKTTIMNGVQSAVKSSLSAVRYNSSNVSAVISYSLQNSRYMTIKVFNQQGKLVSTLVNGDIAAGMHQVVWDAKHAPAGVYVARMVTDGNSGWSEKIILRK